MPEELEILKKKLLYRASYRGTKEMDILLSTFVKKNIDSLNINQLKDLEKFLELSDETISNYYNLNIIKDNIDQYSISENFKNFKI